MSLVLTGKWYASLFILLGGKEAEKGWKPLIEGTQIENGNPSDGHWLPLGNLITTSSNLSQKQFQAIL